MLKMTGKLNQKNYCLIRDKSLLTLVDFTTPYYRSVAKKKGKH